MRVPCEWGNRGMQACFSRLLEPLPIKHHYRRAMLTTIAYLTNFRVRVMGYGQIQQCYRRDYQNYERYFYRRNQESNLDRYLKAAMRRRLSGDSVNSYPACARNVQIKIYRYSLCRNLCTSLHICVRSLRISDRLCTAREPPQV